LKSRTCHSQTVKDFWHGDYKLNPLFIESMKNHEMYGLERLNALTDGVIAIALTLLVLGIDIPSDHNFSEDGLKLFLFQLEPGLIAYATSFIVIAVYWIIHHRVYNTINFSNNLIVLLNILFLFSISLIPFVAKIKSMYRFDSLAVLIFAIAHIITGLILYSTWKYCMLNPKLLKYTLDKRKSNLVSLSILTIPVISLLAILVSFINIHIASYLFLTIPFVYIYTYRKSKPLY
jgi:uncharacterized membrane protein